MTTAAQAEVLWQGGFEDGTRSEFSRYHAVESSSPRINVINKPAADGLNTEGSKVARVEVKTGDDARKLDPTTGRKIGNNVYRERAELMIPSNVLGKNYFVEGDEIWVSWQAMFPSDKWWGVDQKGGGTIVFQIHHVKLSDDSYNGSPPLMLSVDNDTIRFVQCLEYLCPETVTHHAESLQYDHWYTFVMRAKNSSNAANGQLDLWVDGEHVVDQKAALLFGSDFGNYILTGQYRRPNTEKNSVYYVDNYVMGTTKDDVMPPPVEAPVDPVEPVDPPVDPVEPADPEAPTEEADPVEDLDPVDTSNPEGYSPNPEDDVMFVPGTAGCSQAGGSLFMLLGLMGLVGRANGSSRLRRNSPKNRSAAR